jgi:hypothetical protein
LRFLACWISASSSLADSLLRSMDMGAPGDGLRRC